MTPGERLFALLLRLYPRHFRERYQDDLLAFFRADRAHPRYGSGLRRPVRFWHATLGDLARGVRATRASAVSHSDEGAMTASSPGTRQSRRSRRLGLTAVLAGDLRTAWRSLRGTPGATGVAVAVLTLGIGAATSIYAVADAVAFRPLPFGDPDALVHIAETDLDDGRPISAAAPNYLEWRARQTTFEDLAASQFTSFVIRDGDRAERTRAVRITPNLFGLLRVAPARGRLFTADDAVAGRDAVAILSDGFWRRQFGADPDIVGRTLTFAGGTRQIVGVMPAGFTYPLGSRLVSNVDFWVPLVMTARDESRTGGRNYNLLVVGRLKADATIDRATIELERIRDDLAAEHPRWFEDIGLLVRPLQASVVGPGVRSWMWLLLAAVGFVMLIAAINVANVLLTRASARGRELCVRSALGATRTDLVRGMMVESLLLAAIGAAGGLLLALFGVGALRATLPDQLPRAASVAIDFRVFLAASVVGLVTGLVFGLVPALKLSKPAFAALRDTGRANTATRSQQRWRSALVAAEVSLAIVLLVGAGLFVSSFVRILQRDLGFDPRGVLAVSVTTAAPDTPALQALADRLAALPGVESAAAVGSGLPLSGSYRTFPVTVAGRAEPFSGDDEPSIREVTPEYLSTLRMSLVRGRWITADDSTGTVPVVAISEQAARRYFGDRDPLGQAMSFDGRSHQVVGVVASTRALGPESEPSLEAFVPLAQASLRSVTVAVRLAPGRVLTGPALRAEAWSAVPGAIVSEVETLERQYADLIAQRRFNTLLIAVFGVLALAIVSVGIFGVMACVVDQRTQEIGVRMALGAGPAGMLRLVLGRATALALVGLAIGLVVALLLEQTLRAFLFQPRPFDPVVYALAPLIVVAITLVAAYVPARRASRVDPIVALRT